MRRHLLALALLASAGAPHVAHAPPLIALDPADPSLAAFHAAFDAESGHRRVLALLSPT
jgi:hypothetical protein